MDKAEADQQDRSYKALGQQADTRPTVGECRIESLQGSAPEDGRGMAKRQKRPNVRTFFLLLASIQLDNAALQSKGYGVGPIVGTKLRQNIGNAALHGGLAN